MDERYTVGVDHGGGDLPAFFVIDRGGARDITLPLDATPGHEVVTLIAAESEFVLRDWDGRLLSTLPPHARRTFRWRRGRWRCVEDNRRRIGRRRALRRAKHGWR